MSMQQIRSSSGIGLAVEVRSPELRPTVLFLHGGGEHRGVWSPIAPPIEAMGWRTVMMDLRGHGDSEWALSYRVDDFLNDVVEILGQCCGEPVIIVGGSMGAILGAIIAGEKLANVDALVMLDTPTRLPSIDGAKSEVQKILSAKARGVQAVAAVDPKCLQGGFVDDIQRDLSRLTRAARKLEVPVLLVHGQSSRHSTEASRIAACEDIPHAQIERIPGGHLIARDNPAKIIELVAGFVGRHWPAFT